jgi:hypothetical protein
VTWTGPGIRVNEDIYKGGVCNLAATAAAEGGDGLYSSRDPFLISPFHIRINWSNHDQDYMCFRASVRYAGFVKAQLNRRGWVFQERLLNPSVVNRPRYGCLLLPTTA